MMRKMNAGLLLVATTFAGSLAAQEPPPRPARAPRPAPTPRAERVPGVIVAPSPRAPMVMDLFDPIDGALIAPMPAIAPVISDEMIAPLFQGRVPRAVIDRSELERIAEQAREQAQVQAELAREQGLMQWDIAREQSRIQSEIARENALRQSRTAVEQALIQSQQVRDRAAMIADQARMQADMVRGQNYNYSYNYDVNPSFAYSFGGMLSDRPPSAWAQRDPADSMWRAANQVMNKGDYRQAAAMFKQIPVKYQHSAYAADAMYWTAHALYRVGSTPDLQEALQTLEQLKQKYPNSRLRGSQTDVAALQVRIAGVLSSRGQGGSEIVRRALANNANVCDSEQQQVRAAALSALMQTDEAAATEYAQRMLANRDECSEDLRRNAVLLIGNKGAPDAAATLIRVAKTDPAIRVRTTAVQYLGRVSGDQALAALEELARTDTAQQIQREAIRQLARNASPRARNGIKALVENESMNESLRVTALDALDPEHSTQEDVVWLQGMYSKVNSARIKSRIINAMARIGDSQNEAWFTQLANNENEAIDVRVEALRRAGQNMDIAALGKLYDGTGQRSLRYELVRQLNRRREPQALDKLGEIAKNGTDIEVRRRAISYISEKAKTDARAQKLLLEILDGRP